MSYRETFYLTIEYFVYIQYCVFMDYKDQLRRLSDLLQPEPVYLKLPHRFSFRDHDTYEFEEALSFFDWDIHGRQVKIDISECKAANYQTLSLLVLYSWHLKNNGCTVSVIESKEEQGASEMWRQLGARGTFPVLFNSRQTFSGKKYKPLLAVRNNEDFKRVLATADDYTSGFNLEFIDTLRYVLSELLYNTLEHGKQYGSSRIRNIRIPSIAQFTWYKTRNEIQFIIADNGVGIKKHIEQAYPGQATHLDALRTAIQPKRSGTFGASDPYTNKNNAGMGLYLSTNIIKRLNAEMHIISGDGLLHVSPMDITGKNLNHSWPGTFVVVTLRVDDQPIFALHDLMQEFRKQAITEQKNADERDRKTTFYLHVENYFGRYPVDKEAAIKFKEKYIFPAISEGKDLILDFVNVQNSPHSFLSALLASPIKRLGMSAYKKIKILNAHPEIRETIDFILSDNTD